MRVAFYAPMKPPNHPVPSGDRLMARLLMEALRRAGHDVHMASSLRSYDRSGDPERQARIRELGARTADRYLRQNADHLPDVWFTYHLYHKAPDWLGPYVADRLGIPYVVAEASHAPKRAGGPWAIGFDGATRAIARADAVLSLNPTDGNCVLPLLKGPERLKPLKPFIDVAAFRARIGDSSALKKRLGLDEDTPVLLAAAMMRDDAKRESYKILAAALSTLTDVPWRLIVAGDGVARQAVLADFAPINARISWLGAVPPEDMPTVFAAADLFVWPAVNEAYGMVFLEAQAAGCAIVAGRTGGVPGVVEDGLSGRLTPVGDAQAFADAVRFMLTNDGIRRDFGLNAVRQITRFHDMTEASRTLDGVMQHVVKERLL